MSMSLSGNDLINVAIDIERRGIAFYDIMARSADNETARDLFQHLVEMERGHIKVFQDMLDNVDASQTAKESNSDYTDYLQALVDNAVFNDDLVTSEMASQADSDIKALELGISAEKDSLLFYYEMKDIMPQQAQSVVNKIITEEKSHLRGLSKLKRLLEEA